MIGTKEMTIGGVRGVVNVGRGNGDGNTGFAWVLFICWSATSDEQVLK